jgi:hypothetical protein
MTVRAAVHLREVCARAADDRDGVAGRREGGAQVGVRNREGDRVDVVGKARSPGGQRDDESKTLIVPLVQGTSARRVRATAGRFSTARASASLPRIAHHRSADVRHRRPLEDHCGTGDRVRGRADLVRTARRWGRDTLRLVVTSRPIVYQGTRGVTPFTDEISRDLRGPVWPPSRGLLRQE